MNYAILIYEKEADFARRGDPAHMQGWTAYSRAVAQAGIMVAGAGLLPPDAATTLRMQDGKRHVQDGPFADAKEQLGGFYVIDVPDLDAALAWAARCPAADYGAVEVRPVLPPPPMQ